MLHVTRWKACVLYHSFLVGFESFQSPVKSGRIEVLSARLRSLKLFVMFIGNPERNDRIPLFCQPPRMYFNGPERFRPGISQTQCETNMCCWSKRRRPFDLERSRREF